MTALSLSVVIPAYNEVGRLRPTLEDIAAFGRGWGAPFEIVVVDDGSTDGTAELAQAFEPRVVLVRRPRRGGKGRALRDGVMRASHEWVLLVDADHAVRVEQVERFAPHAARCDVIIGSKRKTGADVTIPVSRRIAGLVGQWLIRTLAVRGFSDTQCGFKLLRREVARELLSHQRITGFGYDFEMLFLARRLGHEVLELPVECRDLSGGSVRLSSYLSTLAELVRFALLRWTRRYPRPAPAGAPRRAT